MATLANLDVNLLAHTRKFDVPIKKSGETFSAFTGKITGRFSKLNVGALLAAAGTAAVTGAFAAGIKVASDFSERIKEISTDLKDFERFGLGVDQFGKFKVLASEAALEVEDLVDLTKDLSVRIGEANIDGGGEIFGIFRRLGLDTQALASQNPARQFEQFAEAISKVENETERLALTDILLSDAGTKALQIMKRGKAAFEDAGKAAKQYGLEISSVDAAALDESRLAIERTGLAIEGVANTLTVEVAPSIGALAGMFNDAAASSKGFSSEVSALSAAIELGVYAALQGWDALRIAINVGNGAFSTFASTAISGIATILSGLEKLSGSDLGSKQFKNLGVAFEISADRSAAIIKKVGADLASGNGSGDKFLERLEQARKDAEAAANSPPQNPAINPEIDWSAVVKSFSSDWQSEVDRITNAWEERVSEEESRLEKSRQEQVTPNVGARALARGSSAAQTAINLRNNQTKPIEKVEKAVREMSTRELAELSQQTSSLDQIVDLARNSATFIGLEF